MRTKNLLIYTLGLIIGVYAISVFAIPVGLDNTGICNPKTQSTEEFFTCTKRAAEQGNIKAQYNLGVLYSKGKGTTQDIDQWLIWTKKAAAQGYEPAKKILKELK